MPFMTPRIYLILRPEEKMRFDVNFAARETQKARLKEAQLGYMHKMSSYHRIATAPPRGVLREAHREGAAALVRAHMALSVSEVVGIFSFWGHLLHIF
jgi:hypothetical protein